MATQLYTGVALPSDIHLYAIPFTIGDQCIAAHQIRKPYLNNRTCGGAGAEQRHTFVLQLCITTPRYGHLILQMAVYAL